MASRVGLKLSSVQKNQILKPLASVASGASIPANAGKSLAHLLIRLFFITLTNVSFGIAARRASCSPTGIPSWHILIMMYVFFICFLMSGIILLYLSILLQYSAPLRPSFCLRLLSFVTSSTISSACAASPVSLSSSANSSLDVSTPGASYPWVFLYTSMLSMSSFFAPSRSPLALSESAYLNLVERVSGCSSVSSSILASRLFLSSSFDSSPVAVLMRGTRRAGIAGWLIGERAPAFMGLNAAAGWDARSPRSDVNAWPCSF
mmetsp:Transcript_15321/g.28282  ORF Transcript_15321/g.28282 Transcript_15321/m.28282 type:complete len:263 (-) Transcript_15321:163-951(-)